MTRDELNASTWSESILKLPDEEQAAAIRAKIFEATFDLEASVLRTIVRHHKLLNKLIVNDRLAQAALELCETKTS